MNILETKRLLLRQFTADDAKFILELVNEPAFIQNIGDRGVRSIPDAQRYIETGPVASYARFGFGLYLVLLKESGESIGEWENQLNWVTVDNGKESWVSHQQITPILMRFQQTL